MSDDLLLELAVALSLRNARNVRRKEARQEKRSGGPMIEALVA